MSLANPVPLTLSNLVKIAGASDPRTSALAVHAGEQGDLFVWGLVDQQNPYHRFVTFESESGPDRPGLFEATVSGPGRIAVYVDYEKIAELRIDTILKSTLDVLGTGPIRAFLQAGLQASLDYAHKASPDLLKGDRQIWERYMSHAWIATICRMLLRVQSFGHGGAILITPDVSLSGLNCKYKLHYPRLRTSLLTETFHGLERQSATHRIFDYMDAGADSLPLGLYLDKSISTAELEDNQSELEGAIWLVSLLTRVDGLVIMDPTLEVLGFGAEITYPKEPPRVLIAGNARGTDRSLREADYNHFGTRHRSMMRYCWSGPPSVGFVVSQDGDVRVIAKHKRKLIMWENIRLHLEFEERPRRRKRIASGVK